MNQETQPIFQAVASQYMVPEGGTFRCATAPTRPPGSVSPKKESEKYLDRQIKRMDRLQRVFYADDRYALLLVFQAMDAAGKDSTIRAVMRGINPAGCQVFSFKKPTTEELDHDFLWRTSCRLPERGRIGIFNRSYYEEVLVVRVHPDFLKAQKLPDQSDLSDLWRARYESIVDHEKHLARNGTIILKFWLNVSQKEQKRRFISRIENPDKNWKFSEGDLRESSLWNDYMSAYEDALSATSKPWAPWYAIPADDKPFMRACVADIIVKNLERLNLRFPAPEIAEKSRLQELRRELVRDV